MKGRWTAVLFAGLLGAALAAGATAAEETLIADRILASSTLEDGSGFDYSPHNLQDFDANTAWVEGVEGNGVGETLRFEYPVGTTITGGVIFPGYQKNEDILSKNSAPTRIQMVINSTPYVIDLTKAADIFYGNTGAGFSFGFQEPVVLNDGLVIVTILDVRAGWKYEDTCISELRFTGIPAGGAAGTTDPQYSDGQSAGQGSQEPGPSEGGTPYGAEGLTSTPDSGSGQATSGAADPADIVLTEAQKYMLASFCQYVCEIHMGFNTYTDETIYTKDLTAGEQAFILYWYQYNVSDHRIDCSQGDVNTASYADLTEILGELFRDGVNQGTMNNFIMHYALHQEGETVYMPCTGDFGSTGYYYFDPVDSCWSEDGLLAVTGALMEWNSNMQCYVNTSWYTAYYEVNPLNGNGEQTFCLRHVRIGG